jgi:hypothetical protein
MKLTDEFCWGVKDLVTGEIVARSRDGWRASDKARALNRKAGSGAWEAASEPDTMGRTVFQKNLSERYGVVMKQD